MNQSENINELAMALSKAQSEMQAAIKDSVNPFFKSKYADLNSVWDAARPVLTKNGLCVMQTTELSGEKTVLVTTLAHSSGQWMKSVMPLNPSKNDSQGMGAAITYLRRYSLSALVGVVCDNDDDGETDAGRGALKQQAKPQPLYINQGQQRQLNELLDTLGIEDKQSFLRRLKVSFGTEVISEIPVDGFDRAMTALRAQIKISNQMVEV